MAYAYWRGNSVWIGWTDGAGVPHREPSAEAENLTQGKKEALELETNSSRRAKGLPPLLKRDTPFPERAEQWLRRLPEEYRTKRTAETFLRHRIIPFLDKPCRSITREDVGAMLLANEKPRKALDLKGRGVVLKKASAGTKAKLLAYVHTIFEWLIEDLEVVDGRNPAGGKRLKVKEPKRLARYIPITELVKLFEEIPSHYRLLFAFAIATGVRKGELIPLLWTDFRLEERHAVISKSQGFDTTKTGRDRIVPLPQWLVPLLEAERDRKFSRYAFPNAKGERHRFDVKLTRVMRTAAKHAGLVTGYQHTCRRPGCKWNGALPDSTPIECPKCRFRTWVEGIPRDYKFKDLRSTFGTLATAQGGDIYKVQQVLGHASVTTTQGRYVRALPGDLSEWTDSLSLGVETTVRKL